MREKYFVFYNDDCVRSDLKLSGHTHVPLSMISRIILNSMLGSAELCWTQPMVTITQPKSYYEQIRQGVVRPARTDLQSSLIRQFTSIINQSSDEKYLMDWKIFWIALCREHRSSNSVWTLLWLLLLRAVRSDIDNDGPKILFTLCGFFQLAINVSEHISHL